MLLVYNEMVLDTMLMAESVRAGLNRMGVEAIMDKADSAEAWHRDIDAIMVFGGDGTILRTVQHYAEAGLPVMSVNMGTVGFLSSVEVDEVDRYLPCFINGEYDLDEKMMLDVDIYRDDELVHTFSCLNELVVRSTGNKMIHFNLMIDGQSSGSQRGDGLIIATPTGSTAYNLSAGGPVLDIDLDAMVITPMASYFLNKRPVVVSPEREIRLDLHGKEKAHASIDGQVTMILDRDNHIIVRRSSHRFNLACFKKRPFFETMEKRLRRLEIR